MMEKIDLSEPSQSPSTQMILKYFLIIFLITIFLVGKLFAPFLSILVLAFVLAGSFHPAYRFLTRYMRPSWASMLTCTIIFLFVFVPLVFFVGALSKEAYALYQKGTTQGITLDIKELVKNNRIMERINSLLAIIDVKFDPEYINSTLSDLSRSVGLVLFQQASAVAQNVLTFVVNFALMLLVIFFLFIDGENLVKFLVDLSPLPEEQDRQLMAKFHEMASVVLLVNGISGLLQGCLGGVVFAILGFPNPIFWGFIMGILAFFPIVGIAVVLLPTAVYLFSKVKFVSAILVFVFYVVISPLFENIVKPKMVGDKVKMPTLLVFFSILGGMKAFGVLGIIYGPLVMTAFLTLADIYRSNYETYVKKA